MTDLIPKERLDDGFERLKFHVESLLQSSKLAFDAHHYQVSIGLSILAYEEIFKMQMFFIALQSEHGISNEIWNLITKGDRKNKKSPHVVKYEKSYLDRKKFIEERGFTEHLKAEEVLKKTDKDWKPQTFVEKTKKDPLALDRLVAFNKIKNACFYLDWKNNEWQIFTKISKSERKALAELLLWIAEFHYCISVLDKRNPTINIDENSPSFQKYINDPLFKRHKEMIKQLDTRSFMKTRILATKVIDEYRLQK